MEQTLQWVLKINSENPANLLLEHWDGCLCLVFLIIKNLFCYHLNDGIGKLCALQLNATWLKLSLDKLDVFDSTENFGADVPIGAKYYFVRKGKKPTWMLVWVRLEQDKLNLNHFQVWNFAHEQLQLKTLAQNFLLALKFIDN